LIGTQWAILTGEYPPQPGGVSDYTRQVAEALAAMGDEVHIWAPATKGSADSAGPVHVHRLPDHFGRRGLALIGAHLREYKSRVLVQYVPHAYGCRAMNVRFCRWVRRIGRGGTAVDIMFHEVAYPSEPGQPIKHKVLARVNRWMARLICEGAKRIFISIPGWENQLRGCGVARSMQWLPVPSNIALEADPVAVAGVRLRYEAPTLIGHFGTYGSHIAPLLREVLLSLVRSDSSRKLLLLGRGGEIFAAGLLNEEPLLRGRIYATGSLGSIELANPLAASDLLVQPYPDGISCRRSSAMAGLALGVPIVSTVGHLTESLWVQSGAVALALTPTAADLVATSEGVLGDAPAKALLGERGRSLYAAQFHLQLTVDKLRDV
jgi:glycosyltransferase involved in cell wall biosynthesis